MTNIISPELNEHDICHMSKITSTNLECSHCHQNCTDEIRGEKSDEVFCCYGCKVVFELLDERRESKDFIDPEKASKYAYLNHPEIKNRLLDFKNDSLEKISVHLPQIHCSSCIFLLENLNDIHSGVLQVTVAFSQRNAEILYQADKIALSEVAALLDRIGYAPDFTNLKNKKENKKKKHKILYQLGIAGFFFGNTMLLALPEYLQSNIILNKGLIHFFHYLMLAFSLPVILYSARDYFINSFKSLRAGILSIDLPIVIGVSALFIRSTYEVLTQTGAGYFDSLSGLIFFLLLGKWYQRKTYENFSFDRDYRSFLPLAATRLKEEEEVSTPIEELQKEDIVLVRAGEIIPCDGTLQSPFTQIDYSYISGESIPVEKLDGNTVYAGGRILSKPAEIRVTSSSSTSYLSSLWAKDIFKEDSEKQKTLTDKIAQYFTPAIIIIALLGALAWSFIDPDKSILVFTAVLIVACPCALALAEPFASGSTMRWFGRFGFFLKNTSVLNQLPLLNEIIFDKTGTLTEQNNVTLSWNGEKLSQTDLNALYSGAKSAQHPLARSLQSSLPSASIQEIYLEGFKEFPGEGIEFNTSRSAYKIGKASFVNYTGSEEDGTTIYISKNSKILGSFTFHHHIRQKLPELIAAFENDYKMTVLSGDNEQEKKRFSILFGKSTHLLFNQSPLEKLEYIKNEQNSGFQTLMIGDGLNDAGALKQSNVGVSLCEENVHFFPASDALLKAKAFHLLPRFLELSKINRNIVQRAFVISLIYNLLGLSFALSGILSPLVCAILMPLSSATVVVFTTLTTRHECIKLLKNRP